MKDFTKKIVLENGTEFYGYGFGADKEAINEIVFNTSMVGYQELISDSSYAEQMVVMTYPLIGNYGITDEDYETKFPTIGGLIVREYNDFPSNFRYTKTLSEVLEEHNIPAIYGVDTRRITRIIRSEGSQKVLITAPGTPNSAAMEKLKSYRYPTDIISRVSCKKRWFSRTANHKYDIVAVDCGIKYNIIRLMNQKGCNVTIVPYNTPIEEILAFNPDGVFLSNGPGNPESATPVIELIRQLRGKVPIFRYLPRTADDKSGLRSQELQNEVRTPRRQPSRKRPANRQDTHYQPEPQLCHRCRVSETHRVADNTHQSAR